jgi:hypothetical protein
MKRGTLNAQRSTLNAQRSTLNAQRSTLNAQGEPVHSLTALPGALNFNARAGVAQR